nr:helix-turn-helix domain-containing protein [Rhodococcus ruber]
MSKNKTQSRRRLVSVAQAAEELGVCGRTIRNRISDGTITGYRLGPRLLRVDLDELDALLRPVATAPKRGA